ncbi:hypothetical protein [Conexibacter sp. DBS9H8]|uniref:hypothetical protein n=1 Tax=Conexibacter sp. DBS9H8 TaxID=2937801 RepID=UPI00200FEE40|nr:hypothetical protein [Conexibacter sp. DBS9H8]
MTLSVTLILLCLAVVLTLAAGRIISGRETPRHPPAPTAPGRVESELLRRRLRSRHSA